MLKPHPLGIVKISKLLFDYSIPAIVAMTATSVYNIVDRIFIGQGVGPDAISGVALTLPFMNMGMAFGALVGAGSAALVSIRLGEKRENEAVKILGNTMTLNLILGIAYSVVALFFLEEILIFFGASPNTLPYAKDFMEVILAGNVFLHLYLGFNNIMRASGYPVKAMLITLVTVLINLALAPLFIFVFEWGIRGAAFATFIAQFIGFIYVIIHFVSRKSAIKFKRGTFGLEKKIVIGIFSIGMSPFIIHIGASGIAILINRQLKEYGGDFAIGAFGIVNSVIMCVVLTIVGLSQGMQPIAGFNYGAKQFDRVRLVFRQAVIVATIISTFGFLMSEILPRQISMAFTSSEQIIESAVFGLRAGLLIFPLIGFQITASNFFQSIGKAEISVFLALSRQVLFLVPALIIVPMFFGLKGVWGALPIADTLSVLLTFLVYKYKVNKILPVNS
ncbi:MAG: MATE family efflux transporter [Leptospirales bacterium]|nr:MATE family efflux transporter [Leptospirales bacterium]